MHNKKDLIFKEKKKVRSYGMPREGTCGQKKIRLGVHGNSFRDE